MADRSADEGHVALVGGGAHRSGRRWRWAGPASALLLGLSSLSAFVHPVSADPISSKRAEAAALATRLQALSVQLNSADESYDQAVIAANAVRSLVHADQQRIWTTQSQVGSLVKVLRANAVTAFMDQGSDSALSGLTASSATDLTIRQTFMKAVETAQQDTIDNLQLAKVVLVKRRHALSAAQARAAVAVNDMASARTAAANAADSERQLLAQVQGQLAQLVAQQQAAEQAAAERAERAKLAAEAAAAASAQTAAASSSQPAPVTVDTSGALPATTPAPATGNAQGTAVSVAEGQLGKPYVWAGSGPDVFDCSGLVMYSYAAAGIGFPHSAQGQYDETTRISYSEAEPGDLVFFGGGSGDVYHVGIYVGNGQMIDAPYTGVDVRYDSVFMSNLVGFGRVG